MLPVHTLTYLKQFLIILHKWDYIHYNLIISWASVSGVMVGVVRTRNSELARQYTHLQLYRCEATLTFVIELNY